MRERRGVLIAALWAPPRDLPQLAEIDLGVAGRGGQVAMAQQLADVDQQDALTRQPAGESVPQAARADMRDAGAQACPLDDVADQLGADRARRRLTVKNTRREPRLLRGDR
jgi:hypothetical protein